VDESLFVTIVTSRTPLLDSLMPVVSDLGRSAFIWLAIAAIASVYPTRRMAAWRLVLAVGLTSLIVNAGFKPLVDRARPFDVLPDVRVIDTRSTSASFPSGHAANAFAGALAAGRLLPGGRAAFWALAALIAVSRVYVGVHWPTDVVAGALIGLACGWFALGGRRR
jgi:undecaprenyl-diphosphatase